LKIHTTAPSIAANGLSPRAENTVAQAYGTPGAGVRDSGSAHVALSPASRQLLALQDGGSDIDTDRVQAIRAAIAAGTLKIDPSRIADSLISSAQELLK